jgi:hypothetical protein
VEGRCPVHDDPKAEKLKLKVERQQAERQSDKWAPEQGNVEKSDADDLAAARLEIEKLKADVKAALKSNASVAEFWDSDSTMLNERLVAHYGVPDVTGERLRRVFLAPGTIGAAYARTDRCWGSRPRARDIVPCIVRLDPGIDPRQALAAASGKRVCARLAFPRLKKGRRSRAA